jgi:hypothetical protein
MWVIRLIPTHVEKAQRTPNAWNLARRPSPTPAHSPKLVIKDAAGGLLSPLGPSPLCDYSVVSDNSLLLYQVHRGNPRGIVHSVDML